MARQGFSLVELMVALVILEFVGAGALAAVLTANRLSRRTAAGQAVDAARWAAYRQAEADPSCRDAATAGTRALVFAATAERAALSTVVRCGP